MNAREILQKSADWLRRRGYASSRLDAEVLLAHVLGTERLRLFCDLDRPLDEPETDAYRALVLRRGQGEPVAYLTGRREFYGLELRITRDVFVPRPETELLVDLARERRPASLLDLCTGSGCIAIACASRLPAAQIAATDLSAAALAVARANAETHGLSARIRFFEGDLFAALPAGETYDLILSNPPYVPEGEAREVAAYEPRSALYAGTRGLDAIARILREAPERLREGGAIALEMGEGQADEARSLASAYRSVTFRQDLAGTPRILIAEA